MYDTCGGFHINVKESHRTALERQITEAVNIEIVCLKLVLNRNTGYKSNNLLRINSTLNGGVTQQPESLNEKSY